MYIMTNINDTAITLVKLGDTIRSLRIARGDTQTEFAARIGVSRQLVASMERGDSTVQVGHWLSAWWALNKLTSIEQALGESISLFDLIPTKPTRRRASSTKRRS
jgi:transcriptional regulator with XRE-family HTH domain